jgi:hypothetical protein
VFGADQDEARVIEIHERMAADLAESHDGSPASRPHVDRVGTRRDPIADAPVTGCRCVALVCRFLGHAATAFRRAESIRRRSHVSRRRLLTFSGH